MPNSLSTPRLATASQIKITNLTLTNANIEYTHTLQNNLQTITVIARTFCLLKFSFTVGELDVEYLTVPEGCSRTIEGVKFNGKTIYIQSPTAGVVVEIEELYS